MLEELVTWLSHNKQMDWDSLRLAKTFTHIVRHRTVFDIDWIVEIETQYFILKNKKNSNLPTLWNFPSRLKGPRCLDSVTFIDRSQSTLDIYSYICSFERQSNFVCWYIIISWVVYSKNILPCLQSPKNIKKFVHSFVHLAFSTVSTTPIFNLKYIIWN